MDYQNTKIIIFQTTEELQLEIKQKNNLKEQLLLNSSKTGKWHTLSRYQNTFIK
jgi:hypothetical protein